MLRNTGIKSIIRSETIAYIRPQINVSLLAHTNFLHAFLFVTMDKRQNHHTHTHLLTQTKSSLKLPFHVLGVSPYHAPQSRKNVFKATLKGREMVMFGNV